MRRSLNAEFAYILNGSTVATWNGERGSQTDDQYYPRAHLKRAPGWDSSPDTDEQQLDLPVGFMGEYPTQVTSRGKTQTFELRLEALTEPDLNDFRASLRGGFQDLSSVGVLLATPWQAYGSDIWGTFARVAGYSGDDDQSTYGANRVPSPWVRDAIVSFRQKDARWYWMNESGTFGQKMLWEDLAGDSVTVENTGSAPTDPVITVFGVSDGQDVHIGIDLPSSQTLSIWFRDPGAGDLVVDFSYPRTAFLGTTDVLATYDDATTDNWWDPYMPGIPPGTWNVWRGAGAGTGIRCEFFSADW